MNPHVKTATPRRTWWYAPVLILLTLAPLGCSAFGSDDEDEQQNVCLGNPNQIVEATPAQCETSGGIYVEGGCYCGGET